MAIDMNIWQGRVDAEDGELGLRFHQKVQNAEFAAQPGVMLLGFACDEGVSRNKGRTGAYSAPHAIRQMLANLPWHHQNLSVYDGGNVACDDHNLTKSQQRLAKRITDAMNSHHFPMVLGGGHEVAWATFQGLANRYLQPSTDETPKQAPRIGIVNFDAHFDLRPTSGMAQDGSSGTPFSQIAEFCQRHGWPFHYACLGVSRASNTQALFQRADELNVLTLEDSEITASTIADVEQKLSDFIADKDAIYLTIDMDVFPGSAAPGVSAPAVHGVDFSLVERLVRTLCAARTQDGEQTLKIADIAELNPRYDIDNHTSRLAARLVWTITRSLNNPS